MNKLFISLNLIAGKYEKLISVFFISGLSLAISIAQLWIANSQVTMNSTIAKYNTYKTYPQVEVVRSSDEKDTVKIINRGGEWFDIQSDIITILYAQTNSSSGFRNQQFIVTPIRTEFVTIEEDDKNVVLISTSEKSYKQWKQYELDFAIKHSNKKISTAINYSTYIYLRYRNIYGEVFEKYYMLSRPTSYTRESESYKHIFDSAFSDPNYQIVRENQNVNDVIEYWVSLGN